jgi:hypothetical protein
MALDARDALRAASAQARDRRVDGRALARADDNRGALGREARRDALADA